MANTPQQENSPKESSGEVKDLAGAEGPSLKQETVVVLSLPALDNYSGDLKKWHKAVLDLHSDKRDDLTKGLKSLLSESEHSHILEFAGELVSNLIYHDALQLHGEERKNAEKYLYNKESIGRTAEEWKTLITERITAAQGKEMKITASTKSGSLVIEAFLLNEFPDFEERWENRFPDDDMDFNQVAEHGRGLLYISMFCEDAKYVCPKDGGPLLRFTQEPEEPSTE